MLLSCFVLTAHTLRLSSDRTSITNTKFLSFLFSFSYIFLIIFIFGCSVLKAVTGSPAFSHCRHFHSRQHCLSTLSGSQAVRTGFHTHLTSRKHTHPSMYTDKDISKLNTYTTAGLFMRLKALFSLKYVQLMYVTESWWDLSTWLSCEECNFTLVVVRVGPHQCLNMLVSICKHTHMQGKRWRQREQRRTGRTF